MASAKNSAECIVRPKEQTVTDWLFLKQTVFMELFRQVSPKKSKQKPKNTKPLHN